MKRRNYYENLRADYSRPGLVPDALKATLIADAERYIALKEATLPQIGPDLAPEQVGSQRDPRPRSPDTSSRESASRGGHRQGVRVNEVMPATPHAATVHLEGS